MAASLAPHLVLVLPVLLLAGCQPRRLDDRITAPFLPASALEVVADLPHPPGNIAVSDAGRVFFTYHPDGDPPVDVVELVNGTVVPYLPRGGVEFETVLYRHPALMPMDFALQAPGRDMWVYGLVPLRIGVDSIALDRRGEWLYFGPLTGDRLSRIATRDLLDASLSPDALATRVEDWAPKPISDGITTDDAGRIYLPDPEHSAILVIGPDRTLATLVKDDRLRWPDGFSLGPGGWL